MQQALASKNKIKDDVIADKKRRLFLKSLGVIGLGALGATMFPKKTSALVMGGTPATSVVGVKDASNVRISPATETSLASVKTNTDTLVTNSNKFTFSGSNLMVAKAGDSDAVGLKDIEGARINPLSEDNVILLRRMVKLLESRATVDVANRRRVTFDAWGDNLNGPLESGTATGTQSLTQLVDTTKHSSWLVDKWSYFAVKITGGTGSGQIRMILNNTATTLTLQDAWTTLPDATSTYGIYDIRTAVSVFANTLGNQSLLTLADTAKAWTTNAFANFAVRITSSLGEEQIRLISSNTATVLTLATAWTARVGETQIQESGTALGTQGANTFTDTSKVWTENFWANYVLAITSGTGLGQALTVASNTTDTLTLNGSWLITPDSSSTYTISAMPTDASSSGTASTPSTSEFLFVDATKSWTTNAFANYLIKITSGTGYGQVRHISSNTATTLTISTAWSTWPDLSSTYAIYPFPTRYYEICVLPASNIDVGKVAGMPRVGIGTDSTVGTVTSISSMATIGSYAAQQKFGDISHKVYNDSIRSQLTFS